MCGRRPDISRYFAPVGEGDPDLPSGDRLILLSAGFKPREAAKLIRIVSNLLSGYLLLVRPAGPNAHQQGNVGDRGLLRKGFELGLLSLQRDQFPNTVATARELAGQWASDPDRWWPDTVDLLVFGLEAMLRKGRNGRRE
jgi:hypothetical protein